MTPWPQIVTDMRGTDWGFATLLRMPTLEKNLLLKKSISGTVQWAGGESHYSSTSRWDIELITFTIYTVQELHIMK